MGPSAGAEGEDDDSACGTVVCEGFTDVDNASGLAVDVEQDVTVQVFPLYPFLQRSICQCRPVYDMRGCPTFVVWLPRDLNAHLFWKRRDALAPAFWTADGAPGNLLCSSVGSPA